MSLDVETLNNAAQDGHIDYEKWPDLVDPLLDRLNQIVYHEFPTPRPYPNINLSHGQTSSATETPTNHSTTQILQTPTTPRNLPPVPPFPGSSTSDTSASQIPNSQPDYVLGSANEDDVTPEIPALLLQMLNSITYTIRTSFATKPPHTIQRLSELTTDPKKHYRTLPAWLRAVDRVVSVSSTADIFPLSDTPAIVNGVNGDGGGGILWNNNTSSLNGGYDPKERDGGLGSDESLGGALLTPIPWLRDISHEDPSSELEEPAIIADGQAVDELLGDTLHATVGSESSLTPDSTRSDAQTTPSSSAAESESDFVAPSISRTTTIQTSTDPLVPERPAGAVTQGELIRMEQEAGVIPVAPNSIVGSSSPSGLNRSGIRSEAPPSSIALGVGVGLAGDPTTPRDPRALDQDDGGESAPHARGPDVVGTVDMGRVGGRDVQVRIGSPPDERRIQMNKINPNDAQDVLAGGKNEQDQSAGGSPSSDEFVHVSKEGSLDSSADGGIDGADEMQVDEVSSQVRATDSKDKPEPSDKLATKSNEDEDIVLVDADGVTPDQRSKIDSSDLNVGNDTADGTGI